MNQAQALDLINQVCGMYKGTREEHEALKQAIQVIRTGLEKKVEKKKKVEKDEE